MPQLNFENRTVEKSENNKKDECILNKIEALTCENEFVSTQDENTPLNHVADSNKNESDKKESCIVPFLFLSQPDLDSLEDGQQIRTLTIESRDDPRVQEIIHLLLYWINEELAAERIVVKNIQEDIYDGQIIQKLIEKLAQIKIEVPEVSQSEEGQKQKWRIIVDALNRNLFSHGQSSPKWSAELIHGKDIVAILHLLISLATYYRAPIRFPNNVNVQVLIYQRNGKQINKNIVTEQLTTTHFELAPIADHPPCTPALTKARQTRMEFKVQSPSDALMSPCTKMLAGGGSKKPKNAISHPQNVLRNKQRKDLLRKLPED